MLAKLWRPSLRSALPFAADMPSAGGSFPGLDPGAPGPGGPVEVGTDSQPEQVPGYGTWQASIAARGLESLTAAFAYNCCSATHMCHVQRCDQQVSCWGPLFSEPAAEGTEPLHRAVGALVLRLAIQQRQKAVLIGNEAPDNALSLLQVMRAQHRKPSYC